MSKYLKYIIRNDEPLRISDAGSEQNGQMTTISYIPGSAIRGLVVNSLLSEDNFNDIKKTFLSERVCFLNAYPAADKGETELLPSPKGFYEDKKLAEGEKKIQNVVADGKFDEGYKRAGLGQFCCMDGNVIDFYTVKKDSDLKIKINIEENEKRNVFRNGYINPGYYFSGSIRIDDESIIPELKKVFEKELILGNARSAGYGKCSLISGLKEAKIPYDQYRVENDLTGCCYMLLLSDMAMRNCISGEYSGLDIKTLENRLGVQDLEIETCSTSVITVHGYNRKLGGLTPTVPMYEKGSVFKLKYNGTLTAEKMLEIMDRGLGVRKNEGFGRVLFINDYEKLDRKLKKEFDDELPKEGAATEEDKAVLKNIAQSYYMSLFNKKLSEYLINNPLNKDDISRSQLGTLNSIVSQYRYDFDEAKMAIEKYYSHASDKEKNRKIFKEGHNSQTISAHVKEILDYDAKGIENLLGMNFKDKDSIMGIDRSEVISEGKINRLKLVILKEEIRFENKNKEGTDNVQGI